MDKGRFELAKGTQVREEAFGLLFYTMAGPRLFFLPCGRLLQPWFFKGEVTLENWLTQQQTRIPVSKNRQQSLGEALQSLAEKGVIIAC